MKKFIIPVIALIVSVLLSGDRPSFAGNTGKKTIFIQKIRVTDGPKGMDESVTSIIITSIVEKYGKKYNITGTDDIEARLGHEALKQSMGCDDASCMVEIAEQLRADELIYGKITKKGQKYLLMFYNMSVKENTNNKCPVRLECYENQIDWYVKEASKKLMDCKYVIKDAELGDLKSSSASIGVLKVAPVKGLDISVMEFKTENRFINTILPDLKSLVQSGDDSYRKGDYRNAIGSYIKALDKIENDIPPKYKDSKIKKLRNTIQMRKQEAIYMHNAMKIQEIDSRIKAQAPATEKEYSSYKSEYSSIDYNLECLDKKDKTKKTASLQKQLLSRIDSMSSSIAALKSKQGDMEYNNNRFSEAIDLYNEAIDFAMQVRDPALELQLVSKYNKKISIAKKTGTNYLTARTRYLIDSALIENYNKNREGAVSLMKKAAEQMRSNRTFISEELRTLYNENASFIDVPEFRLYDSWDVRVNNKESRNDSGSSYKSSKKTDGKKSYALGMVYGIIPFTSAAYYADNNDTFVATLAILFKSTGAIMIACGIATGRTLFYSFAFYTCLPGYGMDLSLGLGGISDYNERISQIPEFNEVRFSLVPRIDYLPEFRGEYSTGLQQVDGLNVGATLFF